MQPDPDTLERIVPDEIDADDAPNQETLRLHRERYAFAARRLAGGRVLDLACGVGYGTRILADEAPAPVEALGVDVSESAVDYARRTYGDDRVRFAVDDAMAFQDRDGFDAIVSFETVEHLPDPQGFVDRLVPQLRPGGLLFASVPVTPSVDANPHHLHDFTTRSFRALVAAHPLREVDHLLQVQPFSLGEVAGGGAGRMSRVRPNLVAWYARHPGAVVRRAWSTLRFGLTNRYLVLAWRRDG